MSRINKAPRKSLAKLMQEMRLKQLTTPPGELDQKPTPEFPRVCAVLMDWPIERAMVTVVARATGDASIYTTSEFGALGGIGHETVRSAARNCVKVADKYFQDAAPAKDYPYPKTGTVRFYLVGYDEVRVIDQSLEMLETNNGQCSDLYQAVQGLITELRLISQEDKGKNVSVVDLYAVLTGGKLRWFASFLTVVIVGFFAYSRTEGSPFEGPVSSRIFVIAIVFWNAIAIVNWINWIKDKDDVS